MPLTLYGFGQSRSFRSLWALCESELNFDYIPVVFDNDQQHSNQSTQYLSKNSQGKVPTLEHGDFVLTESLAIVNYIHQLSQQGFIPTTPTERARYDELTSFIVTELEQPLWTNGKHRFALPEAQRVNTIFATAEFEYHKALTALSALTTAKEYALGDRFTFADIMLAHTLQWAQSFKFDVPEDLLDYRDRMYQRPAAKRAQEIIA